MHLFDYSFLKKTVPTEIVSTAMVVTDLRAKEELRKIYGKSTLEILREKAVIESVRDSNAIEGIVTTEERLRDIVGGDKPVTHSEQEISGYRDALNLIHTQYESMDVSDELIKRLHSMITSETTPARAGKYKTADNRIIEIDESGKRCIRFTPVPADETEEAMEQFLLAYYDACQDDRIPALLLIPCVVLDFLCIHPFFDGNGRISRLITLLLMYENGYDIGRYISVERMIARYKDAYYSSLAESSKGWHDNKSDYIPFVIFFLQILYRCYKELDDCFMDESLMGAKKNERIEIVLMNSIVPISKSEVLEKLPDVSVRTVEAVLRRLRQEKKIKKIGANKNARYIKV
ncbi:MAG: Fic family protein [Eubacterium sp.]|nr:Fic family protein [Eubacterium sp.]